MVYLNGVPLRAGARCPGNGCLEICPFVIISISWFLDDASCGVGTQRRMADCVRSDGKIVHSFYCRVEGRRVPTSLRMCTVPCPRNCELSEWGIWSSCPEKCNGMAVQRRTRFTLAQAEHGGQSCLESDSLQGKLKTIC